MRALITGVNGQLGRALAQRALTAGHEIVGVDLPEFDIVDPDVVSSTVADVGPDVIFNCAAFTAVDRAEEAEDEALAVNGTAVEHLAATADSAGATLVQVSTDYVFDGRSSRPMSEDDPVAPLSAYGRTKLAGELAARCANRHLIVRTAWLYGEGSNFVSAIRRQIDAGKRELRVVDDQRGSPTWAVDLADALLGLVAVSAEGVVHVVNSGSTTWCGFAEEIVRLLGARVAVIPIPTSEFPRPARRPAFSVLATERFAGLVGTAMPSWQDALRRFLGRGDEPRS